VEADDPWFIVEESARFLMAYAPPRGNLSERKVPFLECIRRK
jgi:hypothetical protein